MEDIANLSERARSNFWEELLALADRRAFCRQERDLSKLTVGRPAGMALYGEYQH